MRRMRTVLLALVLGLLPAIGLLLPTAAQTAEVMISGDECNFAGLQAAITNAEDGATITFDCSETTIIFASNITITKSVTIDGSNAAGDAITFDGNNATNMFVVPGGGQLTVQQLTFQNGNAPAAGAFDIRAGGAIDGAGGDITVLDSDFTNNTAGSYGGAIYHDANSTLTIRQSSFTGNSANYGGAIYNDDMATIEQSSFTDNEAGINGGAIYNDASLEITESSFTDNKAGTAGGAINSSTSMAVHRSSFVSNHAGRFGGGIYTGQLTLTLTLTSSTLFGNTADDMGSTVYVVEYFTEVSIRWSTIVQPADTSPALYLDASLTLEGVILAGAGNNCEITNPTNDSYTLADDASCQLDGAGSHVTEPGLGPVATQTIAGVEQTYYPLLETSPAVEGGGSGCDVPNQEDVDQLGTARPQGTSCDIGAVESDFTNGYPQFGAHGPIGQPSSFTVGNPIDFLADVWDPDGDLLVTEVDCESTGEFTTSMTCTYEAAGTYTVTLRATDTDDAVTIVQLQLPIIAPVNLCANRWSGDLRMPSSDRCASTETLLHIAPDSPATLCANRWTGEARYSPYDRCRSTETSYQANGTGSVPVCVNRWDGTLRISNRCYTTERSDAL